MVMAGPWSALTEERPGTLGALLLLASKLGRLTMALPPRMSTPGAAGDPVGAEPAPPGPGVGEIPARALGSEPWPVPDFPAPEFSAVVLFDKPLPGPEPVPMPEPPPEPPMPGLSPPEGDIAREPLPPVPGRARSAPGLVDTTTPELSVFPAADLGGARGEPISPGAPRPMPALPEAEGPEPAVGGGGIMLLANEPSFPEPMEFRAPFGEPAATLGGGGTMVETFGEDPEYFLNDPEEFDPELLVEGGGGITEGEG